jgi:hypothetical protein
MAVHKKAILVGVLNLIGAAIAIAGVLLPFATLPTGRSVTLVEQNGGFAASLVGVLLIAAILGLTKFARFAWVPSLVAGGVAGYGVSIAFARIEAAKLEIQNLIESSPFGALAENLLGEFEIHGSWTLLFVGAGVSTLGSLLAFSKSASTE